MAPKTNYFKTICTISKALGCLNSIFSRMNQLRKSLFLVIQGTMVESPNRNGTPNRKVIPGRRSCIII